MKNNIIKCIRKLNMKNLEIAILCGLIVTFSCSVVSFGTSCSDIRGRVLRLHVLANSDSKEDQRVKLLVRDAVLKEGDSIFQGSKSLLEAKEKLSSQKFRLENAANQVLKENDMPYHAKIEMEDTFFLTRTYQEETTLPAGHYMAVRILLGDAKGHNWWCVMFPPMCIPAASDSAQLEDVLTNQEIHLVHETQKYDVRFKIIEVLEKLLEKAK